MKLSELKKNEKGIVKKIEITNKTKRRRILDMGITEGVIITIKKMSPFKDPIGIYLRGYELGIRKDDLNEIEIEVIHC